MDELEQHGRIVLVGHNDDIGRQWCTGQRVGLRPVDGGDVDLFQLLEVGPQVLAHLQKLGVGRRLELLVDDLSAPLGTTARLAPRTIRTNYGVLRATMTAAVDAELIALNPCRGVKLPEVPKVARPVALVPEV